MISPTAIIYPGVELGRNVIVEAFSIIGHPLQTGETPTTIIGDNAIIRSHTVIYAGNQIGRNFSCGHKVNIRESNIFGDDVSIGTHSVVEHHTVFGHGVRLHSNVFVPEYTKIHDRAWLGPNVVLTNAKYPRSKNVLNELKGPTIGEEAIIGANSTILPGIHIGRRALVGAGSVVTKNADEETVLFGAPAKIMKMRKELTCYQQTSS